MQDKLIAKVTLTITFDTADYGAENGLDNLREISNEWETVENTLMGARCSYEIDKVSYEVVPPTPPLRVVTAGLPQQVERGFK